MKETFQTWKEFMVTQRTRLEKIINLELLNWLCELEFVDVEMLLWNYFDNVFYNFRISPSIKGINGFDLPKYRQIDTVRTQDITAFEEAWEGLSTKEVEAVVDLFNSYDFDLLYEHFLDIEREKEVSEWRSQLKGKTITDTVQGESGSVEFHLEDENGVKSVVSIHIPYTITKEKY